MNAQNKIRFTVPQFLDWALQQDARYELVDGEPIRMAPERARHNRVKFLLCRALDQAVTDASLDCEVFTDGMTVVINEHRCYEPDAALQCGVKQDLESLILPHPLVVVEVASPTSTRIDVTTKLADYFKVASIVHYLVVPPRDRTLIHHRRDGTSIRTMVLSEGDTLVLEPPGLQLPIRGLWPDENTGS